MPSENAISKLLDVFEDTPCAFSESFQTNYYVRNLAMVNLNKCVRAREEKDVVTGGEKICFYNIDNNFLRQMSRPSSKLPFLHQP